MRTYISRVQRTVTFFLLVASLALPVRSAHADTKFSFKPYLLIGQMQGDLVTEDVPADFSLGWGNALAKGNGAVGVDFDVRAEGFNVLSQLWYTTLSDTEPGIQGNYLAAQQDVSAIFVTETVGLSIYNEGNSFFDLRAGGRFASVENSLSLRDASGETEFSQGKSWIDPVVGFSAQIAVSEKTTFSFGGDYGGFNVSSSETWQALAAANFSINKDVAFSLGYRAMMHDYAKDDFTYKLLMHGPTAGLSFSF